MTLEQIKTKIVEGGRVEIPVEYRRALQLEVGDEILVMEKSLLFLERKL